MMVRYLVNYKVSIGCSQLSHHTMLISILEETAGFAPTFTAGYAKDNAGKILTQDSFLSCPSLLDDISKLEE